MNAPPLRMLVARILMFLLIAAATSACGEKVDPTDPEGAYNLYLKSMWSGDAEGVWTRLAPSSQEYFQTQYESLVEMDEMIAKYLPPTDHRIAREQAGSILTDQVTDGKSLFVALFKPSQIKFEEGHRVGASVDTILINEDETAAELKTLGGDVLYLSRGDDEQWYVMLVRSSAAIEERLKWLEQNESALQQTVEDLIDEERKKREAIIAELMKLDDGGQQQNP